MVPALLCFPHAGAASFALKHWPGLAPGFDVVFIDRPGRVGKTGHRCDPGDLGTAVRHSAALVEEQLNAPARPWIALGHSFGASMAAATVSHLVSKGTPSPAMVVLSCCAAPTHQDRHDTTAGLDDAQLDEHILDIGNTDPQVLQGPVGAILRRRFRQDQALRAQFVAGHEALKLDCPMLTVAARQDPFVSPEQVADWGAHTTGTVEHLLVEGGHFAVVEDPRPVFAAIQERLAAGPTLETPGAKL